MTGADVPPLAQEAMATAEAAWYERDGIDPREAWQAGAHAGWQAGWAAALQWAAQLAYQEAERQWPVHRAILRDFASLLRQEGGRT